MSDSFFAGLGGTLSADIAVPEHERELRFYARVLGTGESPLWREDLMNSHGHPIIGLGERVEAYAHLPLQWMPHFQVADVATSAACALQLGGRELMHEKDDEGKSLWAVLQDPNGAAFGIIPVVAREALPSAEGTEPNAGGTPAGRIAWVDLTVPDALTSRAFYRQVVGWTAADDAGGRAADSSMLGEGGTPAAGIHQLGDLAPDRPPVWIVHLPVGDLAESLRRVHDEGGEVLTTLEDSHGAASAAVIQDPVGACLALVQGG
ncbi:MAG: VOC family protein [Acidobacteriota bacterium]